MPALLRGTLPVMGAEMIPRQTVGYNRPHRREGVEVTGLVDESTVRQSDTSYHELIARMVNRDESALAELYDATAARAYGLALRITGHASAAEEVVSDVYLQVWQQAQRYEPTRGSVLTWLLTICRSRALDSLRRREPAEAHPDPDALRSDVPSDEHDPLDLLMAFERNSALYAAIKTLNTTQQELLALAFFKGMTHQEIAAHTGKPLGTVKTNLRKSMQLIKSVLDGTEHGLKDLP